MHAPTFQPTRGSPADLRGEVDVVFPPRHANALGVDPRAGLLDLRRPGVPQARGTQDEQRPLGPTVREHDRQGGQGLPARKAGQRHGRVQGREERGGESLEVGRDKPRDATGRGSATPGTSDSFGRGAFRRTRRSAPFRPRGGSLGNLAVSSSDRQRIAREPPRKLEGASKRKFDSPLLRSSRRPSV